MKTHKQSDLLVASVVGLEGGRITRVLFDTTSGKSRYPRR